MTREEILKKAREAETRAEIYQTQEMIQAYMKENPTDLSLLEEAGETCMMKLFRLDALEG